MSRTAEALSALKLVRAAAAAASRAHSIMTAQATANSALNADATEWRNR